MLLLLLLLFWDLGEAWGVLFAEDVTFITRVFTSFALGLGGNIGGIAAGLRFDCCDCACCCDCCFRLFSLLSTSSLLKLLPNILDDEEDEAAEGVFALEWGREDDTRFNGCCCEGSTITSAPFAFGGTKKVWISVNFLWWRWEACGSIGLRTNRLRTSCWSSSSTFCDCCDCCLILAASAANTYAGTVFALETGERTESHSWSLLYLSYDDVEDIVEIFDLLSSCVFFFFCNRMEETTEEEDDDNNDEDDNCFFP